MRELSDSEINIVSGGERRPPSESLFSRAKDGIYNFFYDRGREAARGVINFFSGSGGGSSGNDRREQPTGPELRQGDFGDLYDNYG